MIYWLIWLALLIAPVVVVGPRRLGEARYRKLVGDKLGPVLIGVLWMHASMFAVPATSASIDGFGEFFRFWFRPHSLIYWSEYGLTYVAYACLGLLPVVYGLWRARKPGPGSRLAGVRYALFVMAGTFFWHIPDQFLSMRTHNPYAYKHFDALWRLVGNEVLFAAVLGSVCLAAAAFLGQARFRDPDVSN